MGDDNEGDVPIQGRWCACGLLGREGTSHCPSCGRSWPEQLRTRYPHDGGPPLTRDPCSLLPKEMIVKTCEECGAVEGTPHDVGCRVYRHELVETLRVISRGRVPDDEEGAAISRAFYETSADLRTAIRACIEEINEHDAVMGDIIDKRLAGGATPAMYAEHIVLNVQRLKGEDARERGIAVTETFLALYRDEVLREEAVEPDEPEFVRAFRVKEGADPQDLPKASVPNADQYVEEVSITDDPEEAARAAADVIDDPAHYGGRDNPYEVIKVMIAWHGPVETANFCKLNAVKYLGRAGKKGEMPEGHDGSGDKLIEDLRKAEWYARAAADILEHGKVRA